MHGTMGHHENDAMKTKMGRSSSQESGAVIPRELHSPGIGFRGRPADQADFSARSRRPLSKRGTDHHEPEPSNCQAPGDPPAIGLARPGASRPGCRLHLPRANRTGAGQRDRPRQERKLRPQPQTRRLHRQGRREGAERHLLRSRKYRRRGHPGSRANQAARPATGQAGRADRSCE